MFPHCVGLETVAIISMELHFPCMNEKYSVADPVVVVNDIVTVVACFLKLGDQAPSKVHVLHILEECNVVH